MTGLDGISDEDRRGCERVEFCSDVTVTAVTDLMSGAGTDVSADGVYVVTPHDLPDGALVDVEFPLADELFRAVGEIRWRQPQPIGDELRWGLGIEFVHADPSDRSALRGFVDAHAFAELSDTREVLRFNRSARAAEADEAGEPERRKSARVAVPTDVKLKTVANRTSAVSSDLSTGGMKVVASRDFEVGRLVDLDFTLDGLDREVRLLGEVRWRGPELRGGDGLRPHGVEFVDVRDDEHEALETYVRSRTTVAN